MGKTFSDVLRSLASAQLVSDADGLRRARPHDPEVLRLWVDVVEADKAQRWCPSLGVRVAALVRRYELRE